MEDDIRENELQQTGLADFIRAVKDGGEMLMPPAALAAQLATVMQVFLNDGQSGLLGAILSGIKLGAASGIPGVETYAELLGQTGSTAPGIMRDVTNDPDDDGDGSINGVYLRDLDAPNGWRKIADRVSAVRTIARDAQSKVNPIAEVLRPGTADNALEIVDPFGIVYMLFRAATGAGVFPGGAVIGDVEFQVDEADPVNAVNIATPGGISQQKFRRDGSVELRGGLIFDYGDIGDGNTAVFLDRYGVILFAITANGVSGGGGDGAATDFVTWEQFDADPTGLVPADVQVKAAHDYANANGLRVVQKSGRFLLRNPDIEVRTDCDLTGAIVVTDDQSGRDTADFVTDPPLFRVVGKPWVTLSASDLSVLNTTYKANLVRGGQYFNFPLAMNYAGGAFFYMSNELVMYRNASVSQPVYKRDFSIIGQYGGMAHQWVETLTTGTVTEATITQREDSWLSFKAPKFECTAPRVWVGIQVERSMVTIDNFQDIYATSGVSDKAGRVGIKLKRAFAIRINNMETRAHPALGGSYILQLDHALDVVCDNMRAMYGWGMMGNTFAKDFTVQNSHINRFDFHWGAWADITLRDSVIGNLGVRLAGGGRFTARNVRYEYWRTPSDPIAEGSNVVPAVVSFREDYGGMWEGDIDIEGLTIHFSPLTTFAPPSMLATTSFDVVRLGHPAIPNVQGDISMAQRIRVAGVVFDMKGLTTLPPTLNFCIVRMVNPKATANVGFKTLLPLLIDVDGATAIYVADNLNVMIAGLQVGDVTLNQDGARRALRPDGTNCDIRLRNIVSVLNAGEFIPAGRATLTLSSDPLTWAAGYAGAARKWVPRVLVEDCVPALVEVGAKCVVEIRGGVLARVDTKTMTAADVRVSVTNADVQLAPAVDNGAPILSDPARVTFVGARVLPHAWTTTPYTGVLRGAANIPYADPSLFPNIPSTFWIP